MVQLTPFESGYVRCPRCRKVSESLAIANEPTPCCNIPREDCEPWPTIEIYRMLEFVSDQDLYSKDGQRQAIVFLCTTLEMLLEISLRELLEFYTDSGELIEVVLDGYQGRTSRIRLYNKLSIRPLKRLLKSKEEFKTFLKEWELIAEVRNQIVHRGEYSKLHEAVDLIPSILERTFRAFIEVNNEIQQMRTTNSS